MKKILLSFLLCIISHPHIVNAQWEQCGGPYGANVGPMVYSGDSIFANTGTGLYLSTNNGISWSSTSFNKDIKALAKSGSLMAACDQYSLYVSTDNGLNWTLTSLNEQLFKVEVSAKNIYAGGPFGIYLSTDIGNNWSQILPDDYSVGVIKVSGNYIYAAANNGLIYSDNNGTSWSSTSLAGTVLSIDFSGNTIFASILFGGILKSSDNGASWIQIFSISTADVRPIAVSGNRIYAGEYFNGVYVSTNNGLNWMLSSANIRRTSSICISGSTVIAASDEGLYLTSNNGANWNQTPLNYLRTISFIKYGNKIFAGTYYAGLFSSQNGGIDFTRSNLSGQIYSLTIAGNSLLASTWTDIYKSEDSGYTWESVFWPSPPPGFIFITSLMNNGTYTYAGTLLYGIRKSSDNGLTWQMTAFTEGVYSLAKSGPYVFAGSYDGIYRSSNQGSSWIHASLNNSLSVYAILISGNNIFAGTNSGVYVSYNFGNSWTNTNITDSVYAFASTGNNIFAGTKNGIYLSKDSALTWALKNQGFDYVPRVYSLLIDNGFIYAGTDHSVWRRLYDEIVGISQTSSEISEKFSLSQNYPNPFNPETKIRYDVKSYINVLLKIFDINGREIETLVNEMQSPGSYEVTFDASSIPSGIYFYKLEAGEFTGTRKMIVLK